MRRTTDEAARAGWHAWLVELTIFAAAGVVLGVIAPLGTGDQVFGVRLGYWLSCLVGGGIIGILVDRLPPLALKPIALRVLLVSLMMTPPVTIWVLAVNHVFLGDEMLGHLGRLSWQVFAISLPLMTVRALVHRAPVIKTETRTVVETPLPEAEAAFRRRLSARRRYATLIAVEAHDHYLRVHTDQGSELLSMRFSDALKDLERVAGYRVHRSWWIAAAAIEAVRWGRGSGEAQLRNDVVAPVSRRFASVLRDAGWR